MVAILCSEAECAWICTTWFGTDHSCKVSLKSPSSLTCENWQEFSISGSLVTILCSGAEDTNNMLN
jgi:hypothetical protein